MAEIIEPNIAYEEIIEIDNLSTKTIQSIMEKAERAESLEKHGMKTRFQIFIPIALVVGILIGLWLGEEIFVHTERGMHTVCYVTDTGHCYHNANCSFLRSKHETTVYSAIQRGYRNCFFCNVGPLDTTVVHEYFGGIIVGWLVTTLPIVLLVLVNYRKKIKTIRNKKALDIEWEKRTSKERIESLINLNGVLMTVEAPADIRLENGKLASDNDKYYRYVSFYGKCYHNNPDCVNTYLERVFYLRLRAGLKPCSRCSEEIIVPDWYKRFVRLKGIVSKYEISIQSLLVVNPEDYQKYKDRVMWERFAYMSSHISSNSTHN